MSKSDYLETALLNLLFNAVDISLLADDTVTTPLTSLYVSLHTADPTDAGTAVSSECAYTSYAREAVVRSAGGWTVGAGTVSPAANIDFTAATGGTETVTHFAIVDTASGAGNILYSGTVLPNISVATGVTPRLTTATAITES